MSPPAPTVPILERLVHPSGEPLDPRRRLTLLTTVFVFLTTIVLEGGLVVTALVGGRAASALVDALLAIGAVAVVVFPRRWNQVWYSVLFVGMALVSSGWGVAQSFAPSVLLWQVGFPTGVLLLAGPRAGWLAMGADLVFAVLQGAGLGPELAGTPLSGPWLLVALPCLGVSSFLLTSLFLKVFQDMIDAARSETGEVRTRLEQATEGEARAAEQVRFLEALMDLIPFPLFHKSLDGTYIRANASFRVVFDVTPEQVEGKKSEEFLRPENAQTLTKIELDVYARDSLAVEETTLVHADGRLHEFIVYLMPFVDPLGEPRGSIGVLIDITDRKQREERYVALNTTKDQLFSIISHDLRGPVGKFKQLLDIYIDDPSIFDKATWDQVFHDMRRSADSLFQLLENLLSWARSQRAELEVKNEAIPLEPIVQDVFSVLKLVSNEKRITLQSAIQLAGPLMTDRHILSTILRNLVHNALKFTPSGGSITVSAEETIDEVRIEVRDTGIGIPPEVIETIFRRRKSVTTFGTAKERGQGLGLNLCLDLAQVIGAVLKVESTPGSGTTFRLLLPTPEL